MLLEVGPGQALSTLARQQSQGSTSPRCVAQESTPDEQFLLTHWDGWSAGARIDWQGFYADERRSRVPLPTYPFERERYWIEPGTPFTVNANVASLPENCRTSQTGSIVHRGSDQNLRSSPAVDAENETPACWLIFADKQNLTARIVL